MIRYPPAAFHLGSVVPVGIRGDLPPPAAEELLIEAEGKRLSGEKTAMHFVKVKGSGQYLCAEQRPELLSAEIFIETVKFLDQPDQFFFGSLRKRKKTEFLSKGVFCVKNIFVRKKEPVF